MGNLIWKKLENVFLWQDCMNGQLKCMLGGTLSQSVCQHAQKENSLTWVCGTSNTGNNMQLQVIL